MLYNKTKTKIKTSNQLQPWLGKLTKTIGSYKWDLFFILDMHMGISITPITGHYLMKLY